MLVIEWDVMNDAIPRLEAQLALRDYTVAALAHPAADEEGLRTRRQILDGWREHIQPIAKKAETRYFPPLRRVGEVLAGIVGRGLRD